MTLAIYSQVVKHSLVSRTIGKSLNKTILITSARSMLRFMMLSRMKRYFITYVPLFYNCCYCTEDYTHQRGRDYARDEWQDDRRENCVTVLSPKRNVRRFSLFQAREIGMCLCGDNQCHVYTSTEGRKLSSPRHFKMRNGLCRLLFSTKQMLPWHT